MAKVKVGKKLFLPEWTGDFMVQLLVGFNLQIKDLKSIEYKTGQERELYIGSNGTYQDIYFLYFIDYLKDIVKGKKSNNMPQTISRFPIYILYAFKDSLSRIGDDFEAIKEMSNWLLKIFEANEKYINSSKSANMLISKYSGNLADCIERNSQKIEEFFEIFSTSGELSEKALLSIDGFDAPLSAMQNNNILMEFVIEKNILLDTKTRMMIPLMTEHSGKIKNVTPAKIGAVISYARTMTSAQKEKSVKINQAQVISSLFYDYPISSKKNAISNLFFQEINIFTSGEIAQIRDTKEIEQKAKVLTVAILLNDYKNHFNEIKPHIQTVISKYLQNNKENAISAEILYDLSDIIKKEIGTVTLYSELKEYEKEIKSFLHLEIANIIETTIKEVS